MDKISLALRQLTKKVEDLEKRVRELEAGLGKEHPAEMTALGVTFGEVDIPTRLYNCLDYTFCFVAGYNRVRKLSDVYLIEAARLTDRQWLRVKNFGWRTLRHLHELLARYGLKTGMREEEIRDYVLNERWKKK